MDTHIFANNWFMCILYVRVWECRWWRSTSWLLQAYILNRLHSYFFGCRGPNNIHNYIMYVCICYSDCIVVVPLKVLLKNDVRTTKEMQHFQFIGVFNSLASLVFIIERIKLVKLLHGTWTWFLVERGFICF